MLMSAIKKSYIFLFFLLFYFFIVYFANFNEEQVRKNCERTSVDEERS